MKFSLFSEVLNASSVTSWISLPGCPTSISNSRHPKWNSFLQNLVLLYSSPQLFEMESSDHSQCHRLPKPTSSRSPSPVSLGHKYLERSILLFPPSWVKPSLSIPWTGFKIFSRSLLSLQSSAPTPISLLKYKSDSILTVIAILSCSQTF